MDYLIKGDKMNYEVGVQEYIVINPKQVTDFIDKEIGVEYEITECDDGFSSIVVFELYDDEHQKIRDFISHTENWEK